MKTSKFDANELGLLHKHNFTVVRQDIAEKTEGTLYVEIEKWTSVVFQVTKEQSGITLMSTHPSLKTALEA